MEIIGDNRPVNGNANISGEQTRTDGQRRRWKLVLSFHQRGQPRRRQRQCGYQPQVFGNPRHSLPAQWQQRVLDNELRITGLLIAVLAQLAASGTLPEMDDRQIEIAAHNIVVLGHTWTFRRWYLARHYSIDDYIALQTEFILKMCTRAAGSRANSDSSSGIAEQ